MQIFQVRELWDFGEADFDRSDFFTAAKSASVLFTSLEAAQQWVRDDAEQYWEFMQFDPAEMPELVWTTIANQHKATLRGLSENEYVAIIYVNELG